MSSADDFNEAAGATATGAGGATAIPEKSSPAGTGSKFEYSMPTVRTSTAIARVFRIEDRVADRSIDTLFAGIAQWMDALNQPCLDEHQTQNVGDDNVVITAVCSRDRDRGRKGEFPLFHKTEDRQEASDQMKAMADAAEVLIRPGKNRPLKQIIGVV